LNTSGRSVVYALIGLIICLLWFALTPTDIWLQQFLFDIKEQRWIWSKTEPLARLIVYDGIKTLLIIFAVGLAISLACARYSPVLKAYSTGIRIVLLSLILVPACVGALKNTTNIACPRDLIQFGGKLEYVGIVSDHTSSAQTTTRQRCFPAGHASGGFALLSLAFFFKTARNRRRAIYFALATGWTMGIYKMLIGDHFLSHTMTTMLLAWLIINVTALANRRTASLRQIDASIEAHAN